MSDCDALPNSDSEIQGTIEEFDDPKNEFNDSTVISAKSPIAFAVGLTSWPLGKSFRASCYYQSYKTGCFDINLYPSDSEDHREIVSHTKNYSDASQAVAMLTELYNLQVKILKNESDWATFYQHLEKTNAFLQDTQCHESSK